jgi:hypothetical protein
MKTRLLAFIATLLVLSCMNSNNGPTLLTPYNNGKEFSSKTIRAFGFATPKAAGVITATTNSIAVTVPYGTDVTALKPTISQTGAFVSPASGVA